MLLPHSSTHHIVLWPTFLPSAFTFGLQLQLLLYPETSLTILVDLELLILVPTFCRINAFLGHLLHSMVFWLTQRLSTDLLKILADELHSTLQSIAILLA